MIESRDGTDDRATVAFVGAISEPQDRKDNPAYSAAGTQMQERLVTALRSMGTDVSRIMTATPVASFPRSRRLWFSRRDGLLLGVTATFLSFVNLAPMKPITAGLSLVREAMRWRRQQPRRRRVMLVYNVACPPGLLSVVAARVAQAKVIAIVADLDVPGWSVPNSLARRIDYRLQRLSLRFFDGLIVLTRAMAEDCAAGVPWIQMEGAMPPELESWAPRAPSPRRKSFVVMYSGRFSAVRGLPVLLDSFRHLERDDVRLWITGSGELRGAVEDAAARDPRIEYLGFPDYPRLLELYAEADALVNPHSTHPVAARYLFPSKLLEYLATGTAVISTASAPEIAEEYRGLVIPVAEATPEALAQAIRAAASMPFEERRAMARRAREFMLSRKRWNVQARRVAEMIAVTAAKPIRKA